jgi:sugar phosphate isomerase/epimerase
MKMVIVTRREAGKLLAMVAGSALMPRFATPLMPINSVIHGVQIGAQSYSFRDLPLDGCIEAYRSTGLGECELWEGTLIPPEIVREAEASRRWHLTVPLNTIREARQKFEHAGVLVYAFNAGMRKEMSDEELERGFQMAQELGAKCITASAKLSMAGRVDKVAQKYNMVVGFHGHDNTNDPDEFSTADTFERAMKGASKYIGVNLDIGHFVAAGGDPLEFLRRHHERIVTLHLKDRKKNHGPNVPWGEGDVPIVEVLRMLRDERWKISANIEYEYGRPGLDTVSEVKRCFEYCRKALET